MDYTSILLGLLFAFAFFHGLINLARKTKTLPPGPRTLPIIGNLHLLIGGQTHTTLTKLSETYGPIMRLKLGSITTVIVSSPTVAKEILQKHDIVFSRKRIPDAVCGTHDRYKYSVAWLQPDSQWRALRKIMATNIFTNNRLESNQHLRFTKIQELIAYCSKSSESGEAIDVEAVLGTTLINMMSNIIFSKDLADYYSHTIKEFKHTIWKMSVDASQPNIADFFPVLKRFDPQGIRGRFSNNLGKVLRFIDSLVNERIEERVIHGSTNNDVLDVFLNFYEDHPNEIGRDHINHTILDLFVGGSDTTSTAIEWAMAELLKNPDIMVRAKDELEKVIGRGKPVKEVDITRLPYLQCIMKETFRLHPPGPFLFPRQPEHDVEVCGYTIPKDSQVLVNIWAIGRDSSLWENPLVFDPERFLRSDLDIRGHDFELIPFGSGRRMCPGFSLAVKTVPLILGSLINSFDWKLENNMTFQELNLEEKFAFVVHMAYPLRVIPTSL